MVSATVQLQAQDDGKTTFPLENFYVKRDGPGWRKIFRNFRLGVTTGYGRSFMNHDLSGYGIYQPANGAPSIFANNDPNARLTHWVNRMSTDSTAAVPGSFLVNSDTAKIGFKGHTLNIPLRLTLHYEFLKRFRIGVGYSWELMSLGQFHAKAFGDKIGAYKPASGTGFMKKYFLVAGASFYRIDNYLFTGDINVGGWNPGSNFTGISKGIYFNLGLTVERELSEYLKLVARPSFDFKSYTLNVPGTPIKHHMNALYLNVGISYTLPELRKCFLKDCKIQMNHAHGNKEYRSRVHPIYKKQNPAYGENHPTLIKYKGKNKKKLNPY